MLPLFVTQPLPTSVNVRNYAMTVLTDICSGPECTNRPQWSWPASPEAPTYNSTYIWGQEPHFSSAWGLQPLPQLFCRSAGLSTAYIWPWTLLIWTLICRLTSQLDLRAVLSPWICLAQANGLDPSLTTSATSVPALLLNSEQWMGLVSPLPPLALSASGSTWPLLHPDAFYPQWYSLS